VITSETLGPPNSPRVRFTGQLLDYQAGLNYHHHRWYDPAAGRWISEDPIGFASGDTNLNRYVANSPTIYVDPSGLTKTIGVQGSRARFVPSGFWDSIAHSIASPFVIAGSFAVTFFDEDLGEQLFDRGVEISPWGQTEDADDFTKTTARGGLVAAGLSIAALTAIYSWRLAVSEYGVADESLSSAQEAAREFFRNPLRDPPPQISPFNPRMPRVTPPELPPNGNLPPPWAHSPCLPRQESPVRRVHPQLGPIN
jgi:RHS repeat-associated protein